MADIPRVVLTGGVSGGHMFPLIAVAQSLRKLFPGGIEFLFIGSRGNFESDEIAAAGIPMKRVLTGKWRRYFSLLNIVDFFKVPVGFFQALWHLFFFMPDAVFAKGGAASVPVVLAAWLYRIPVLIHDSDAVAGRANRFLSHFVQRIAIAYPSAHQFFPAEKTALTGNPVRQEILLGDGVRAATRFKLSLEKPTVFVFGGSLGAQVLNMAVLRVLPRLLEKNIQVLHQTGSQNHEAIVAAVAASGLKIGESGYVPQAFFKVDELADVIALATVVLSRAGASSIAELAATRKAAILVPLEGAANDEQRMNAYDVAALGGALVLEEANLGEHILFEKIEELLGNAELRKAMGEKLQSFFHPDAADAIASGVYDLIQNK
ncbi:MAG: undecaprenyldiphospho-muramoylpentapeptide beta-N-acetylglucosaminyltransferase [Candidatus Moranbacteria bacterium]|nr:undecaprenyldiphospho-muramoylpentapeptide beta-N-acetylglucosaminyltransferase [Candidatus Moranbacteria bacterium]